MLCLPCCLLPLPLMPQAAMELDSFQSVSWTPGDPLPDPVWQAILAAVKKAGISLA